MSGGQALRIAVDDVPPTGCGRSSSESRNLSSALPVVNDQAGAPRPATTHPVLSFGSLGAHRKSRGPRDRAL